MKRVLIAALAISLLGSTAVPAQTYQNQDRNEQNRNDQGNDNGRNYQDRNDQGRNDQYGRQSDANARWGRPRWSRGDQIPRQYRQTQYVVSDWRRHNLSRPARGYAWYHNDNNDYFLAVVRTGVILQVVYSDDRNQRWNHRYTRTYTYNDDSYYQQCRSQPDPAGIIAGALIGGLLGNSVGRGGGQAGATVAGVIVGGAVGAALTSNLDCQDRSYAYKTYSDGFNSGRANTSYSWRNPANDHRGQFRVGSYYNDQDGFRCANYTQVIYVQGRQQTATGRACRQPDGSWAIIS